MSSYKYLLILVISYFSLTSTAQIVYTDIDPDTTLAGNKAVATVPFVIDLNNDGTNDFYFQHMSFSGIKVAEFYTYIGQDGEVLVDSIDQPIGLSVNDTISSGKSTWINKVSGQSSSALFFNNWAGSGDHYIGIRFKISTQWHYGWIRCEVLADTSAVIVKDFAWNSTAETRILAGDKGSSSIANNEKPAVSLFPNPTAGSVNIQSSTSLPLSFKIRDLRGEIVDSGTLTGIGDGLIDLPQAKGLYFVEVGTEASTSVWRVLRL